MTTRIIIEMDEDLLKAIDNKIKSGKFKNRDETINYYTKYGILIVIDK